MMLKKLIARFSRLASGRSIAIFISGFELCGSILALIEHQWMLAVASAVWAVCFQIQVAASNNTVTIILRADGDDLSFETKKETHVTTH